MRVLKDEAVLDPTAMEKEVREQMAEREQAHQDRNLARMLTPAERREKKMRKIQEMKTAHAQYGGSKQTWLLT